MLDPFWLAVEGLAGSAPSKTTAIHTVMVGMWSLTFAAPSSEEPSHSPGASAQFVYKQ